MTTRTVDSPLIRTVLHGSRSGRCFLQSLVGREYAPGCGIPTELQSKSLYNVYDISNTPFLWIPRGSRRRRNTNQVVRMS